MPDDWAASGARMAFSVDVEVSSDDASSKDAEVGRGALALRVTNEPEFVGEKGVQRVAVSNEGGWRIDHNDVLRCWLDVESAAARNDVTLAPGRYELARPLEFDDAADGDTVVQLDDRRPVGARRLRLRREVQLQGAGPLRIITRHVWPLCISSLVIRVTLDMAGIILTAAGRGFQHDGVADVVGARLGFFKIGEDAFASWDGRHAGSFHGGLGGCEGGGVKRDRAVRRPAQTSKRRGCS